MRKGQSKSEAYRRDIWNYKNLDNITMDPGGFPGGKGPENFVDHPPTSSVVVKGTVEHCLYCLFGPSRPVLV